MTTYYYLVASQKFLEEEAIEKVPNRQRQLFLSTNSLLLG